YCPFLRHKTANGCDAYVPVLPEFQEGLNLVYRHVVPVVGIVLRTGVVHYYLWHVSGWDGESGHIQTALAAIELARTTWIRLETNLRAECYRHVVAQGNLGEPPWPAWGLSEWCERALKPLTIDRYDHPLLKD